MLPPLPPNPYTSLRSERVLLEPLKEEHFPTLIALGSDPRIWEHFPESRADAAHHWAYLEKISAAREACAQHPYVILLPESGRIAGFTRLHNWNADCRRVETGSWLHPDFWRSGINVESKWLLLRYCFEDLRLVRVQFRTSPQNQRSRQALAKLGATFEGILRNDRILPNGRCRDTALYSIIVEEWPQVQEHLLSRMRRYEQPGPAAARGEVVVADVW